MPKPSHTCLLLLLLLLPCRFESLRSIVVCFLEAVPLLMSVVFMLLFFLFVFGVAATELFSDVYHHQCVDVDGDFEPAGYGTPDEYGCGFRHCPTNYTCEVSQGLCPAYTRGLPPCLLG
jgi:hypothetical protein